MADPFRALLDAPTIRMFGPCEKCAWPIGKPEFKSGWVTDYSTDKSYHTEWFDVTCERCGWRWKEPRATEAKRNHE